MRIAKTSPIVSMYRALVAAGLQPTVRLNRRTVGCVREADRFVVWEMVQLRPDFFAAHFNDLDADNGLTFFGPLPDAVRWLYVCAA